MRKVLAIVGLLLFLPTVFGDMEVKRSFSGDKLINYPMYGTKVPVTVTLDISVNESEEFYIVREYLPSGLTLLDTGDFDTIQDRVLSLCVTNVTNKSYTYTVEDNSLANRGLRFYGFYMYESDYLNEYEIQGDQLLDVETIYCITNADTNGDRRITYYEYKPQREAYRRGDISREEFGRVLWLYRQGWGC